MECLSAITGIRIDWLNANTTEEFSFFAIEIELWRIGSSSPAPRFNVIASPNDWTRTTRTAVRQVGEGHIRQSHRIRMAYWASFADFLKADNSSFRIKRTNTDGWFSFPIGRSGFVISATISTDKQRSGIEFYVQNDVDKSAFRALHAQKETIEREFGEILEWQELPGKKASRIVLYKHGADPSDEKQYAELHTWMLDKLERFKRVFGPRVKALPLSLTTDAGEDGPLED